VAAVLRNDGEVRVRRDSLSETTYPVDLPLSAAIGFQYRLAPRILLAGQGLWKGWGATNAELVAVGGTGPRDTWEGGFGAEYYTNIDRPTRLPIRLGIRRASMPFPLQTGEMPVETNVALGTGFLFAQDMGGVDLALERVWRNEASAFEERAWLLTATATLRPGRRGR
jgi:hypothetical protein